MDMHGKWLPLCFGVLLVFGFPRLVYGVLSLSGEIDNAATTSYTETSLSENCTKISVLTGEIVESMDLEEYLVGVLLCEIPGDFHIEAQKAQAVVARTYALQTVWFKNKHKGDAICTNPGCCQGYRDPGDYLSSGGTQGRITLARLAVQQTKDQVLTYQGALIDATYFSCSGGQTEDALAVWGADVPYLQSVSSPGEESATYYQGSIDFSAEQFQEALGRKLYGAPKGWFGKITYTRGGGVESIVIGGITYEGTEIRSRLGLRSTAFEIRTSGNDITITTKGYGHRVGMSQYGAQAMAKAGKTYPMILAHYYPGTEIDKGDLIR
jgi:stage II sporulation protein D